MGVQLTKKQTKFIPPDLKNCTTPAHRVGQASLIFSRLIAICKLKKSGRTIRPAGMRARRKRSSARSSKKPACMPRLLAFHEERAAKEGGLAYRVAFSDYLNGPGRQV